MGDINKNKADTRRSPHCLYARVYAYINESEPFGARFLFPFFFFRSSNKHLSETKTALNNYITRNLCLEK